jgi:hypothetical protein
MVEGKIGAAEEGGQGSRADDAAAGDRFGYSTAIDGDTIVAGADLTEMGVVISVGSAYAFESPFLDLFIIQPELTSER